MLIVANILLTSAPIEDPFSEMGDIIDKCSLIKKDDPEVPELLTRFKSLVGKVNTEDLDQREHFGSTLLIKACFVRTFCL